MNQPESTRPSTPDHHPARQVPDNQSTDKDDEAPPPAPDSSAGNRATGGVLLALSLILLGSAGMAAFLQTTLSSSSNAAAWMSWVLWEGIARHIQSGPVLGNSAQIPFLPLLGGVLPVALLVWMLCGVVIAERRSTGLSAGLARSGRSYVFWLLPGVIELFRLVLPADAGQWFSATGHLWMSLTLIGWLTTLVWAAQRPDSARPAAGRAPLLLTTVGVIISITVFVGMNWRLYDNFLVPHGDSAMYEEHLWNVTHGKGFRSYLDQGLFLGEHIQVIHLALLPVYVFWPSHLLLELTESIALAVCVIPIFTITRRHTGVSAAAALLAGAWLLYFPAHYLDISIDFKTFRPISLGVPLLLFGIDQWERGRLRTASVLWVLTLLAKEDFALVLAPLALYFAVTAAAGTRERRFAWSWCAGAAVYVAVVVLFLIPAFRAGENVHYGRYFGALGSSPGEIVKTFFTDPGRVLARLFSMRSLLYTVLLLLPCGGLPLLSCGRLAVVAPTFAMLCLLELSPQQAAVAGEAVTEQMLVPFHHFHAPLLPILFWAAAAGLSRFTRRDSENGSSTARVRTAAACALIAGAVTGVFYSMSPLGAGFWDPGSRLYWRSLYLIDDRAHAAEEVVGMIPVTARVASTDFIHPRFTHHERSYDYSGYRPDVPDDADYIVIDAQHPWPGYSQVRSVADVPELREQPRKWAVIPLSTRYFIVLQRVRQAGERTR